MELSVSQICKITNGRAVGNQDITINRVAPIEDASEGTLSFISNPAYAHFINTTKASVLLVSNGIKHSNGTKNKPTLIYVDDVSTTVSILLNKLNISEEQKKGIEEPSFIDKTAKIGKDVYIGAFVYVGKNAVIGDNVQLEPHVFIGEEAKVGDNSKLYSGAKVYRRCELGKNCIIHSGAIIGSDGFGYAKQKSGAFLKTPQAGNVVLKDHVEIGANTTIDRATINSTIIEEGVKLDNLVHIAHNVHIGKYTMIAAQTGISGSTKIGSNCLIAGQVGIIGHIKIADGTQIGAKSGISKSISESSGKWHGIPAGPLKNTLKSQVIFRKLPEIEADIKEMKKNLEELKQIKDKLK